ncbi:hypothetical protein V5P93_005550 [Actinokineospora auranticolor]|uniref:Uncharacterized protein n=1 Tax=Actinokineospora auranticolor TaxID=155976 RepID=A0A2S6GQB0_9PSEU|nr:hypothetical protein [Actinokineospora auranticolor]PPK67418.1 hypothetical protein CLV40_10781 [Actinokineospora auranticolor]
MSDPQRPGPPWPPEQYNRAGETEWIPRVQGGRRPDEPFQFQEETPRPAGNPALTWALRIAGLVAIAVVSGLVFWYVSSSDDTTTAQNPPPVSDTQVPDGQFAFTKHPDLPNPVRDTDCVKNSYNNSKVRTLLTDTRCESMTRALFTTEDGGHKIYTSVAVVRMANETDAQKLRDLTDGNNTGNVDDVVKAKLVKVEGLNTLANGGYDSIQDGRDVVIVESDWAPGGKRTEAEGKRLAKISLDATRLGKTITSGT